MGDPGCAEAGKEEDGYVYPVHTRPSHQPRPPDPSARQPGAHLLESRGSLDYLGLNYYTEERVRFDRRASSGLFVSPDPDPSLPRSSLGWSIDAAGLRRALVSLWEELRLPLWVTENGVADEDDELRPGFLADHLRAVVEALGDGADVRGYLYWTGFDNFEWLEGYGAKFGLVAVDRATLERRPKPSAEVFAGICRTGVDPGDARLLRPRLHRRGRAGRRGGAAGQARRRLRPPTSAGCEARGRSEGGRAGGAGRRAARRADRRQRRPWFGVAAQGQ